MLTRTFLLAMSLIANCIMGGYIAHNVTKIMHMQKEHSEDLADMSEVMNKLDVHFTRWTQTDLMTVQAVKGYATSCEACASLARRPLTDGQSEAAKLFAYAIEGGAS